MTVDHVHTLPPGTRFEEYRLNAVLGAGGYGNIRFSEKISWYWNSVAVFNSDIRKKCF